MDGKAHSMQSNDNSQSSKKVRLEEISKIFKEKYNTPSISWYLNTNNQLIFLSSVDFTMGLSKSQIFRDNHL